MNLELLESFGQNYPEDFDGELDCISYALTCHFNRRGSLIAVGCNDGRILIWDFITRGVARNIVAHVHPICSVSWSRDGHLLLSASTDNSVCIWNVSTGDCVHHYRFPSPVLRVQFSPRTKNMFLVCPLKHPAVLVKIDGTNSPIPTDDDDYNIVASFDRRGEYIYTGNGRGKVLVFRTATLEQVASFRVVTGSVTTAAIKQIEFARRGSSFLLVSADRIIRVYETGEVLACGKDGEPEPVQKLQDLVNKTMWKKCCFSGDGEYVCAGSARQHSLYIWEKSNGNLVKILHGTKGELLLDVVWHPVRPIIASISRGLVSIWAQTQVENWSAFAPDFKELDENVEYEEHESEFDVEDEDKSVEAVTGSHDEDMDADVTLCDPIQAFLSSDEETENPGELTFLPVSPEIEEPEDSGQKMDQPPTEEPKSKHRPPPSNQTTSRSGSHTPSAEEPASKRVRAHDVALPYAATTEAHPLLSGRRPSTGGTAAGGSQEKNPVKKPPSNRTQRKASIKTEPTSKKQRPTKSAAASMGTQQDSVGSAVDHSENTNDSISNTNSNSFVVVDYEVSQSSSSITEASLGP